MTLYGIKMNGKPLGVCITPCTYGLYETPSYDVELDEYEDTPWFTTNKDDAELVKRGLGNKTLSRPSNGYFKNTELFSVEV